MERLQEIRRLFTHDGWANRETLGALRSAGRPPERALAILSHILGAERLWLDRVLERKPAVAVWPDLTLERCRGEIDGLERSWDNLLDDLSPDDLEREIVYVNTKGERWSSSVRDVLSHVVLHSAHHRGQIASGLRAAGLEPPYTDFIHAVRQGFIE